MNVFITGGTGYIGNRTVDVALRQGHQVTVLTRSKEKAKELENKGVRAVIGDLLTDGDWQSAISEAEYVIHLAAPPTWGKKVTLKVARAYQEGHYQMTVCLLDNINLHRLKKLVYVAGTSYFGDSGEKEPVTESYCSRPKGWGPYIAPSVDVLSAYVDKGAPIVMAFPGQVYGADSWFPQLFLEPLSQSKPVTGLKGHNPIFSPIHVEDCARAFLFLLEQGLAGERYILVDDQPIRSADITTLSAKALQRPDKKRYVPTWLCRMLLGPVLTEYATAHTNFSNGKLKVSGFTYLYPTIQSGIESVVKEWKERAML
ncbi:NAD-dependent epimerase/dehydratase family protein [Paenibacillus eucommiae]|uniref:Nucleoside-diphosphate-sugar epimerase n=1 Tax=Paenibacillus eucommiae TaxID=1355755 RepID=A0ABS4J739_9BACL|nr:NAD(P)-dependent oxidoreductase [Paenibacillus eucommiae]MBP1995623.1 nucleoside-diphosphate-sugar epimerase [Paenibacillus eucommiae]